VKSSLLRQFITEALADEGFLNHLRIGLRPFQGDDTAQAYQIASDWLEEVELRRGDLLPPGRVSQVERFVVQQWPSVLEQFRGNDKAAALSIMNALDAHFSDLRIR
jgi:hypothetical protein